MCTANHKYTTEEAVRGNNVHMGTEIVFASLPNEQFTYIINNINFMN